MPPNSPSAASRSGYPPKTWLRPLRYRRAAPHPSLISSSWRSGSQGLVHLPMIKKLLLRLERSGKDDPHRLAVCPVNGKNPGAPGGMAQIEVARLGGEPAGIWK